MLMAILYPVNQLNDIDPGTKNQLIHHFWTDSDMKEPVIVAENGDVDIFESVEKAESYIEPIDVKTGDNVFFDSEGKILQASIVKDSRGIERIVITDADEENYDRQKLRNILIDFLGYLNYSRQELEEMELPSLVIESLKFKTE